jgi:hypothetical protein
MITVYRLIKIKVKRKGLVSEHFAKGAAFGMDEEREESENKEELDIEPYDGGLGS